MEEQIKYFENKIQFELDPWDLNEALTKGTKVVIIDTRSNEAFESEHIPGAINLPHRTITKESTVNLDKSQLYVTYCNGVGCNASTKGALNLAKLGFRAKELDGGIRMWKKDGYDTLGTHVAEEVEMGHVCNCGC